MDEYISARESSIAQTAKPRLNLIRIEEELSAVNLRLYRVYIENRSYADVIKSFDRPETFFYVDPPYYGYEDYYGTGFFDRDDFVRLRDILAGISGRFILSINDVEHIRILFNGFRIETVETSYTAAGADRKKRVKELLIMNRLGPFRVLQE